MGLFTGINVEVGFQQQMIEWISLFMKMVKYNFFVSGKEVGAIIPIRGLRRGDQSLLIFFSYVRRDYHLS